MAEEKILKHFTTGNCDGELTIRQRSSGRVELDDFYVIASRRGQGLGRLLLQRAVSYMQRHQLTVYLYATPFDGNEMDVPELMAVYERYGFVRTKPDTDSREMIWLPK